MCKGEEIMKIEENIYLLELPNITPGRNDSIYPTLIKKGQELTLIDTGFPNQVDNIKSAIEKENLDFTHLMSCCEKIFETPVALTDEKFAYVAAVDRDWYFVPFKNSQNALDLKFVSEFICDFSYENTIKLKGVYSYSLEQGTYLCKNIFFVTSTIIC